MSSPNDTILITFSEGCLARILVRLSSGLLGRLLVLNPLFIIWKLGFGDGILGNFNDDSFLLLYNLRPINYTRQLF
jgi:hypothetical protein